MKSPFLKFLFAALLLLSPPASALTYGKVATAKQEAAEEEECNKDEVTDDNGECCVPNMLKRDFETEKRLCAEEPSDMSVSVAFTLIGSFTFLISLQFFMNHPDPDMQEYAYTVISATVSIFSAVLMFQSINGLVEDLVIEPLKEKMGFFIEIVVDFLQMLVWYIMTQAAVAKVTCALKSDEWREEKLQLPTTKRKEVKEQVHVNCICWGMIVAHLTGFASINFWTSFQQIEPFNNSPFMSAIPIILAVVGQAMLQTLTDCCREKYAGADGIKDWFEKRWDKQCEESENDIMGLTLSVISVNSARYLINSLHGHDCLPNSEQKEESEGCDFVHSFPEVLWLLLLGLATVVTLFVTKLVFDRIFPDGEEESSESETEEENEEEEGEDNASNLKRSKSYVERKVYRAVDITLLVLSMAFSWCIFHGFHQLLVVLNPAFLGKDENATTLAVVLALVVTYIAALLMRILDMIADLPDEWTPQAVDDSIRQVIKAMSLFIGFAWEQTFDESVDSLAKKTQKFGGPHAPAIAKVFIGAGCVAIVFLAWKWYILPYVVAKGWTPGYIHNPNELQDHFEYLARSNKDFKSKYYDQMMACLKAEDNYKMLEGGEGESLKRQVEELRRAVAVLRERREKNSARQD